MRTSTIQLSQSHGRPRVWLEGKWLITYGFTPGGKVRVQYSPNRVTVSTGGSDRTITPKRGAAVLDLNNDQLGAAFANTTHLQVVATAGQLVITPARTARQRAARRLTRTAVSLFSGGGLLSQAAMEAGFIPREAVEVDPKYAEIYEVNHPGVTMHAASVADVDFEAMRDRVGSVGLLEMGIPCEPYSRVRRLDRGGQVKRDASLPPEAHELGDMVFWALKAVDVLNPYLVVAEEVPDFLSAGAGHVFQHALRRMGYAVDARVLDAADYGALTARRRAVIIATTAAEITWPTPLPRSRTLAEVLLPPDHPSLEWFTRATKGWLYDHWDTQTARGNGFAAPVIEYDAATIGTIKKRYLAIQGDNQVIGHPADRHLPRDRRRLRLLTVEEIARLQGLPGGYHLGTTKTSAGEVLGQGVQVDLFRQVISASAPAMRLCKRTAA